MKVLVPLDGSAMAEEALRAADRLLRHEDGGVLYLHRVLKSPSGKVMSSTEIISSHETELENVNSYLQGVASNLKDKPYQVQTHTSNGPDPAEAIAAKAESVGADVIIMRSHGKTGLKHFLLGSTTYSLSRISKVSVLIVKRDADRDDG